MAGIADNRPDNRFFSTRPLVSQPHAKAEPAPMKQFRHNVIRAGLEALYLTRAHHLLRPVFGGVGAIFMLHQVRPRRDAEFQPNHHLEITPGHHLRLHLKNPCIRRPAAGGNREKTNPCEAVKLEITRNGRDRRQPSG